MFQFYHSFPDKFKISFVINKWAVAWLQLLKLHDGGC